MLGIVLDFCCYPYNIICSVVGIMKINKDMIDESKTKGMIDDGRFKRIDNKISEELRRLEFVYHRHQLEGKDSHWDLRIKLETQLLEFNLWSNILEENSSLIVFKLCEDMSWFIKEGTVEKKFGELNSTVECLDSGTLLVTENSPTYKKFEFHGEKVKGEYTLRKEENRWILEKTVTDGEKDEPVEERTTEETEGLIKETIVREYAKKKEKKESDIDEKIKTTKLKLLEKWLEAQ